MKTQPVRSLLRLLPALLALATVPMSASVLMLDFGPTVTTATTNSPYHGAEPTFTGSTWTQVQLDAITTGLLYADGTSAEGVSVTVGRSSANNWQVLTLLEVADPVSAALGSNTNTGVFAGTSVGRDGIFSGANPGMVGVSVGGLGAGTYDIYVVGFNTNMTIEGNGGMGVWALATPNNNDRNMAAYLDGTPHATTSNSVSASWVEGSNYVKLSVSLTETDSYLTIFTHGTDAEQRGFLNAIQIVPTQIPEPATTTAMVGLVVFGGVACLHRNLKR